jgi:putative endonuclease
MQEKTPMIAARFHQGTMNHHAGLAAEAQVARHFADRGLPVRERRWRGPGGEIDLICGDADGLVFVEVKAARDHDAAMAAVSARQLDRIRRSAEAYVATMPRGLFTDMRIDVALVDATGRIAVVENASLH